MDADRHFDPELFEWILSLPLYDASTCTRLSSEPGVYFVVEEGELFRTGGVSRERIVRVGRAESLIQRIAGDHYLVMPQLARRPKTAHAGSVFRLHVGGAWLRRHKRLRDAELWQAKRIDMPVVEEVVSDYLHKSTGFHVAEGWHELEKFLIASMAAWRLKPSPGWLGRWARNPVVSRCGLWNVQHVAGPRLSNDQRSSLLNSQFTPSAEPLEEGNYERSRDDPV